MRKGLLIFIFFLIVILPLLSPSYVSKFQIRLLTECFIFGLFSLGLNLLMGYTGIVSFGHALFFGLGGYVTTLVMVKLGWPLTVGILIAVTVSALMGLFLGFIGRKLRAVYIAMLTFAAAQMFYELVIVWDKFLGGTDGLLGMPKPALVFTQNFILDISTPKRYYYFCLCILLVSIYIINRILNSPFGHVLIAIRENELRARFLGYSVDRYKMLVFSASGLFSGLAGVLFASLDRYVSPQIFFWTLSGEGIIMVLIGGMGTLIGPLLGATFVIYLREFLIVYTDRWLLVLGVIFVIVVIFLPKGIYDPIERLLFKKKE